MEDEIYLQLNDERYRVLLSALHRYKETLQKSLSKTALQQSIALYEVRLIHQLLSQVLQQDIRCSQLEKSMNMTEDTMMSVERNSIDWKQSFSELQRGNIQSITSVAQNGKPLQVTYDRECEMFLLKHENRTLLQNQHIGTAMRQFQSLCHKAE